MPKPNVTKEKPFSIEWKSVGIGVVAGIVLLTLMTLAGARLEEWSILGVKFAFPTPAPTNVAPSEQKVLSLEDLTYWVFSYGFGEDFLPPDHFSDLVVVNDAGSHNKRYKLSFSMPDQGDAAAGISFTLGDPISLVDYSFLELSAGFKKSPCDLFLKDTKVKGASVTISESSLPSMRTGLVNGAWQYKINLSNYAGINLQSVKEIGCNAHRCEGECSFELSEIRFTRE